MQTAIYPGNSDAFSRCIASRIRALCSYQAVDLGWQRASGIPDQAYLPPRTGYAILAPAFPPSLQPCVLWVWHVCLKLWARFGLVRSTGCPVVTRVSHPSSFPRRLGTAFLYSPHTDPRSFQLSGIRWACLHGLLFPHSPPTPTLIHHSEEIHPWRVPGPPFGGCALQSKLQHLTTTLTLFSRPLVNPEYLCSIVPFPVSPNSPQISCFW